MVIEVPGSLPLHAPRTKSKNLKALVNTLARPQGTRGTEYVCLLRVGWTYVTLMAGWRRISRFVSFVPLSRSPCLVAEGPWSWGLFNAGPTGSAKCLGDAWCAKRLFGASLARIKTRSVQAFDQKSPITRLFCRLAPPKRMKVTSIASSQLNFKPHILHGLSRGELFSNCAKIDSAWSTAT